VKTKTDVVRPCLVLPSLFMTLLEFKPIPLMSVLLLKCLMRLLAYCQ